MVKRKFVWIPVISLLASLLAISLSPASAALRVPKSTWPACTDATMTYCVESLSVTTARGKVVPLTWVPSGKEPVATPTNTTAFAPLIQLDAKGVVTSSAWWLDPSYRQTMSTPGGKFIDISSLIGTTGMPLQGAIYDPVAKKYDLNWLPEQFTNPMQCTDPATGTASTTAFQDCFKGAVAFMHGNKVENLFHYTTAADAALNLTTLNASTFIDGASLAANSQQPSVGSTYSATTKTFSKVEPLVIPKWVSDMSTVAVGSTSELAQQSSDTSTVVTATTEPGRALSGRWTTGNWDAVGLGGFGYDGLYVDAKAANEFVNHVLVEVIPTMSTTGFKTTLAGQAGNSKYATNLDSDITLNVKLRTGEIKVGVTVAVATDVTIDTTLNGNNSIISVSGNPVTVPLAKTVKDCTGETGIAKANVRQFMALIIVQNDTSGFGIDGTSGEMYVGSNGVCTITTPIWNTETKEFSWTASAPHFAADGTTQNMGFYKAIIPVADAKLLWGLENPNDAATALTVSVTTETGGSTAAISVIAVKNGRIIIDVSGFGFSKPKLKIGLKKGYKPTAVTPEKAAPQKSVPQKSVPQKVAPKKSTITCALGKTTKTMTAFNPICPKGYKKI